MCAHIFPSRSIFFTSFFAPGCITASRNKELGSKFTHQKNAQTFLHIYVFMYVSCQIGMFASFLQKQKFQKMIRELDLADTWLEFFIVVSAQYWAFIADMPWRSPIGFHHSSAMLHYFRGISFMQPEWSLARISNRLHGKAEPMMTVGASRCFGKLSQFLAEFSGD